MVKTVQADQMQIKTDQVDQVLIKQIKQLITVIIVGSMIKRI